MVVAPSCKNAFSNIQQKITIFILIPSFINSEIQSRFPINLLAMQMVQKVIAQWPNFASKFNLDPELGVLIKPTHQVISFNFKKLKEYVDLLMPFYTEPEISGLIKQFPDLEIKEEKNKIDMLILHSYMVFVLEKFLYLLKITNKSATGAVLPKSIAMPLHIAASELGMTYGMGLGIQFNWAPLNQHMNYSSEQFGYKDFQLKVYVTNNHKMQKMFFGGNVIGSYFMGKVIRLIYEINCIIQHAPMKEKEVIMRLEHIRIYIQKIINKVQIIIDQFDYDFFKNDLGGKLSGFNGLIFQGIDKGQDKAISAPVGSGGSDCSYQVLDKGFGLAFKGELAEGHKRLQTMMPRSYVSLIKYFQQKSMIREYCDCTLQLSKAYNQTLSQYGQLLFLHQSFIRKFIFGQSGKGQKIIEGRQGDLIRGYLNHQDQIVSQLLKLQSKN